jgi:N-acetyl-anhydromuramyl-L-alanine amidase AmpD/peptidoglycan hydrolase-like protein with peptidoglycan-binding domain
MFTHLPKLIERQAVAEALRRHSDDRPAIRELQVLLYELGYGSALNWEQFGADGIYGRSTTAAVKAWADKQGTPSDGQAVSLPMLQAMLDHRELLPALRWLHQNLSVGPLNLDDSPTELVKAIQKLLRFNGASLEPDGLMGRQTAAALHQLKPEADDVSAQAQVLLERLTQPLGRDWLTAVIDLGPKDYDRLFPVGNRDFETVQRIRKVRRKETYTIPGTRRTEARIYRYEFHQAQPYQIEDEALTVPYYEVRKFNANQEQITSFCYPVDHVDNREKKRIVLHFTIGQAQGDLKTLTREDYHVSTAYVLGRDGTIYRLFSPKQWSHHLGAKRHFPDHDASSIAIELSNYGPLEENFPGHLYTIYGSLYCSKADTEAYHELNHPYRTYRYYASHTPQQYDALVALLRYLTAEFDIPRQFLPAETEAVNQGRWEAVTRYRPFRDLAEAHAWEGIGSHVNYRSQGKSDIGPAFDWDRVITGVTAPSFTPTHRPTVRSRSILASIFGPAPRNDAQMLAAARSLDWGDLDSSRYGPDGPEVSI